MHHHRLPTSIKIIAIALIPLGLLCYGLTSMLTLPVVYTPPQSVRLPIIMYHSILNDPSRAGKYIVTPDQLEQDLQYIQEQGYTTILMQDLIDYVYNNEPLPQKPILLTFDDGNYNNLSYLYPLLEKYDMKAVISIIGRFTDEYSQLDEEPNNNYSQLTWDQLKTMVDSGRIEVQNHSYNMHSQDARIGLHQINGESNEAYLANITADIAKLQDEVHEHLGYYPSTFTYPFGFINEESRTVVRELGFQASLSCYEHVNWITQDPECLFELGRYNRASGKSSAKFFASIFEEEN